jgi:hypothetical protein
MPDAALPSKTTSALILVATVLTGSLINNVPGTFEEFVNVTSLLNCSLFSQPAETEQEIGNLWTLLMPIFLPVLYIFIKDWNLSIDKDKILALYQHMTGQVMSFSSTEIIRHFIVSPNLNFPAKCNLTELECNDYQNQVLLTNTSQLCRNSDYPEKQIFDSLHSIPNVAAALMGSSAVFLLCNLTSAKQIVAPFFEIHPACQKYKFCSRQLFKFLCLGVFIATVYFCLWQTFKVDKNSLQELVFSFVYGVIVQIAVYKTQKLDVPPQPPAQIND